MKTHNSPLGAQRMASYYTASIDVESNYPHLQSAHVVDVVIIGAGFTGIATALELAERGLKIAVVEANKVGWGASGRNGGQVTGSLSGDAAMKRQLQNQVGVNAEDFIWQLRWRGHEIIKNRVAKYNIQCDLKHGHIHAAYQPSHIAELQATYDEAVNRGMGDEVALLDKTAVHNMLGTPLYFGGLYNKRNMHIHPLNLCLGEARAAASLGVQIFENSPVTNIIHGKNPAVVTAFGRINAKTVLLAGDAYHKLEQQKLGGKLFPATGGIVTTAPLSDDLVKHINAQDVAVYDTRFVLDYYRLTADKRLLFGGGANYSGKESRDIEAELRPAIERTFPALKEVAIEFKWSCIMGIVINRIPQLGKLSDNVYYCQGYSGHGVATSHIMGEIMADAISGEMKKTANFANFASFKHIKVPAGDLLGNPLLAVGMWYYQLLEKLR